MIQEVVTMPYLMLNKSNKFWIDTLDIPDLHQGLAEEHASYFLATLCSSVFKDWQIKIAPEDSLENRKKSIMGVRSVFQQNKIPSPSHWSPVLLLNEVDTKDVKNAGVIAFNQCIDGLKRYFCDTSSLVSKLELQIGSDSSSVQELGAELSMVVAEIKFLDQKIENIRKILNDAPDSPEKNAISSVFLEAYILLTVIHDQRSEPHSGRSRKTQFDNSIIRHTHRQNSQKSSL